MKISGYTNFQTDNVKYTKDRYDQHNSAFESAVEVKGARDKVDEYISVLLPLGSKWRFYPDRFYDSIKPEKGGITWSMYQRVMMRILARFKEVGNLGPRGCAKTLTEVAVQLSNAIHYPNLLQSITASTKSSSLMIFKAKFEEMLRFYPALNKEIESATFSKDSLRIKFVNGSIIDNLANSYSSNGQRRHRGFIEESFLMDKTLYEKAVEPIFNVPRTLSSGLSDPMELNGQISRFTTSGFKNSDEFEKIRDMWVDTYTLQGSFLCGMDWRVPVHFGRQKKSTIDRARRGNLIAFQQNYCCLWTGASDSALININKLLSSRTVSSPQFECPKDAKGNFQQKEYVLAMDIARSSSESNNKSAIAVLEIIRRVSGEIGQIHCVNIVTPSNGLTFEQQSNVLKRLFYKYGGNLNENLSMVKAIILDTNGVGQGVLEEMLRESTCEETNQELGCFATMNTEDVSKVEDAPEIIFGLKAQGINTAIIREFISVVESGRLKLVKDFKNIREVTPTAVYDETEIACDQMQYFIDEVANLKIKETQGGKGLTVQQVTKRVDKDRYSAIAYGIYYIQLNMQEDNNSSGDYDYCIDYSTN